MDEKIANRLCLALLLAALPLPAEAPESGDPPATETHHQKVSADAIAKELANPAGSLASLSNNFEYRDYKGDLPGADEQDGWS